VDCPTCRRQITLLIENFTPEEQQSQEGKALLSKITAFNKLFTPRNWYEYILDAPILLPFLWSWVLNNRGTTMSILLRLRLLAIGIVMILYLLSPFDIFPEAMFGILGYLDDIIILLMVVVYMCSVFRQLVSN